MPVLADLGLRAFPPWLDYNKEEETWVAQQVGAYKQEGWWYLPNGKTFLPQLFGKRLLKCIQQASHMGTGRMPELLQSFPLKTQTSQQAHPGGDRELSNLQGR